MQGNDLIDQVLKVTKLVGTKEAVEYIKKYKLAEKKGHNRDNICFDILVAHDNGDIAVEKPADLSQFENAHNKENCTWEALDLLSKLFVLDYVRIHSSRTNALPPGRPSSTPSSTRSDLCSSNIHIISYHQEGHKHLHPFLSHSFHITILIPPLCNPLSYNIILPSKHPFIFQHQNTTQNLILRSILSA